MLIEGDGSERATRLFVALTRTRHPATSYPPDAMPNAPECQPIADTIGDLVAQDRDKRSEIADLDGVGKWTAMLELGAIRARLAEQQELLRKCQKQHADDMAIEVDVVDVPGVSGFNRLARVWQLTGSGQTVKQTVTVQDGLATLFALPVDTRQSFGLTIEETDHPGVSGPDFRSGPLPPPTDNTQADPVSRVEIVILDPITFTQEDLRQAAPPLPIQLSYPGGGLFGTINISITGLGFFLADGVIRISAVGTAAGVVLSSPLEFTALLHVAPTFGMAPSAVLDVASGVASTLSAPGIAGSIIGSLASFITPRLLGMTVGPLGTLLNRMILDRVGAALGLRTLPSGAVVSVRQVEISGETLTLTPALAAFGRVLSSFQPTAPDAVPRLLDLRVQPTAISTSDSANRVAQGAVALTDPAPAGGAIIVLASDRPEAARVDPATLVIPEGETTGTFMVTGLAQPAMQPLHVDATITAALGSQRLTSPVSVKAETPLTPVAAAASSFTTPQTQQLEVEILEQANQYRLSKGLQAMAGDGTCAAQARSHSIDMAAGRIPLGHDGFFESRAQAVAAGAARRAATAEQVGAGEFTATEIIQGWLQEKIPVGPVPVSPLEQPEHFMAGVGVARSPAGMLYFTIIMV